jgi:hypothetical protein
MRLPGVAKNKFSTRLIPLTAAGVLIGLHLSVLPAFALDNSVNAVVCSNTGDGATITITQPASDSIIDQPSVTLRGQVANATQIEIEIDGQYVNTVPLGANQASYETDVTLSEGTHTIGLTAPDVCQHGDGTASIVITYHPTTPPSNGGTTPTDVGDGVVVGPDTNKGDEPTGLQITQLPVLGAAISTISDFASSIGLDTTFAGANSVVAGSTRVGLTIVSLTLVVSAGTVAPAVMQAVPAMAQAAHVGNVRLRSYTGWGLRIGGLLLMGLVYFL